MRIEIKRNEDLKLERKAKLENILSKKDIKYEAGFQWIVLDRPRTQEEADEHLKELQKFCLSVARDILLNRFRTDQKGQIDYGIDINKEMIEELFNNAVKKINENE